MERYNFVKDILFIDIETVSCYPTYDDAPPLFQKLWDKKSNYWQEKEGLSAAEAYREKAGIYSEYAKVVAISYGFFQQDKDDLTVFIYDTISGDNEKALLEEFTDVLNKFAKEDYKLCAHNGKEFDFPFLSRRILINGIPLPSALQINGLKPWEVPHLDTLKMWAFGDFKNYTPLETIAACFDLLPDGQGMDGSMVHQVYYEHHNLQRIADYCTEDMFLCAMIFLKINGYQPIDKKHMRRIGA